MPNQHSHSHSHSLAPWAKSGLAVLCAGALWSCDTPPGLDDTAAEESALTALPQGGEADRMRTLRSIEVSPSSPLVTVDLNTKGSRTLKVLARYDDRSTADVTAAATYSIDNAAVGTMTGARFDSTSRTAAQVDFAVVTVRYREGGVEVTAKANLTVAWLRTTGPATDLLFTLPYMGGAQTQTVAFGTNAQSLDTFLAVDTTGSMGGEIKSIQTSMDTVIAPAAAALVKSSWLGVGAVEDFPNGTNGSPSCNASPVDDNPFILLSPMTGDISAVKTAAAALLKGSGPRGCGADLPEGQMEALYQIATGDGNVVSGVVNIPPHHTKGRGGVEFRAGALPVVTMVTDAVFHTVGEPTRTCFGSATDYSGATAMAAHNRTTTTSALKNVCARVLGISIDTGSGAECIATADLTQLATDTGAVVPPVAWDAGTRPAGCAAGQCCTGLSGAGEAPNMAGMCPLVMKATTAGTDVGPQIAAGLTELVRFSPSDVSVDKSGDTKAQDGTALPAGKTTADFLQPVVAIDGTAPATPAGLKAPTASGDHFTGVTPGSTVRFSVAAKNDFIAATAKPQVFKAKVQTMASGCAVLDDRDVLIIVPAT